MISETELRRILLSGIAIPAHPLALTASRKLDARRQRALSRYYIDAGAGGLAVAVHTTQFEIRLPSIGLYRPVLELAKEEMDRADRKGGSPIVRVGGICGQTPQAMEEASLLRDLGYNAGLLSLAAMKHATEDELIDHCRAVSQVIPIIGFYLQPAVGGGRLSYSFWRRFAEIPAVVAIKIAPFNRYQTLDVVRAVAESGRADLALYTGNDDNIVLDLITPFRINTANGIRVFRIRGGLLGHWSVWTRTAVELLKACHQVTGSASIPQNMLTTAIEVTDANAAFFDAANGFAGCIAGLHAVLKRQGLLEGLWCLDEHETLSPGQAEEIDRVYKSYPQMNDDTFVAEHRDHWLS